jgi:hypothetical protein
VGEIMDVVTDPNRATGSVWQLRHDDREIAHLTVTGAEMPWTYAQFEPLPGFEPFRTLFAE